MMTRFKRLIACGLALGLFTTAARAEVQLPANYTQLEYIQSTGTQWIDTGYKPGYRTVTTMEAIPVDVSSKCAFFGCWIEKGSGFSYAMYLNGNKQLAATFKGTDIGDWKTNKKAPTAGATYKMMVDGPNHTSYYWKNGAPDDTLSHAAVASGSSTSSMLIFATRVDNGAATYLSKIKFLSMQITEGGTTVRDFVPCRNEKGEAGLWDRVEGKFYGNGGTGRFVGSDDVDVRLSYIQSSGTQWIDTGVYDANAMKTAGGGFEAVADVSFNDASSEHEILASRRNADNRYYLLSANGGKVRNSYGEHIPYGDESAYTANKKYHIESVLHNGKQSLKVVDGLTTLVDKVGKTSTAQIDMGKSLYLFAVNDNGSPNWYAKVSLYSCKITKGNFTTVLRDFVPARSADGRIGVIDLANGGKFYPNNGTDSFTWGGIAYNIDGTTLKLHEGTLAAEDLADYTAIEKVDWYELNAGAVTAYATPLTLAKGVFALTDGEVKKVTVGGKLTINGGVTLKIDATTSACDTFTVTSLDLTGATAANPFMIDISNEGAGTDWSSGETLTLVTGTGLADGICGNIRVTQSGAEELAAAVKDGNLIILRKPAPRATWTGAAGNHDLSDPGNWEYFDEYDVKQDRAPDANTDVYFKGSDVPDITGSATFVAKSLILSAALDRDCDWSGLAATIPVSGKIDLKGNKLTVADLPATWTAEITDSNGYELLDYIQSNSKGEYIDTGYKPGYRTVTTMEAIPVDVSKKCAFFGCWMENGSGFSYAMYLNGNKNLAATFKGTGIGDWMSNQKAPTAGATYKMMVDGPNHTSYYWKNGALDDTLSHDAVASGSSTSSMLIFAIRLNNGAAEYHSKIKFLSMQITEDGAVVRDFVPARRASDGVVGLLDLVAHAAGTGKEFYPNDGAGALTAGAVTGSVGGGELHVNVASGTVTGSAKLTGTATLVKDGEGMFMWNGGANSVPTTCPVVITNGVFGFATDADNVFGNSGTITIAGKGQMDVSKKSSNGDGTYSPVYNRTLYIEGEGPDGSGAITRSVSGGKYGYHLKVVNLTGDATIGGNSRIDFRGTGYRLNGAGHTLTVKNTGLLCIEDSNNGPITAKRIVVTSNGKLEPCAGSGLASLQIAECIELTNGGKLMPWHRTSSSYSLDVPVTVGAGGGTIGTDQGTLSITKPVTVLSGSTATVSQTVTFKDVEVQGTLNATGTADITGTLSGGGTVSGAKAKFSGTATHWAMAANAEGWTSKADLAGASTTALAALKAIDITYAGITSRELEIGPALGLTATTLPLLTVKTEGGNEIASTLAINEDGKLYVSIDLDAVATATWTGAKGDGDVTNPENWDCKNALGGTVSDGLPGLGTTVTFTGDKIPSILVDSDFAAKNVVLSDAMLANDCDWSGLAATILVSGKIDLKGNKLTVADLPTTWDAEITDSNATTVYERLEYIQSTGTQWIDTGYIHKANTKVECAVDVSSTQPNQWSAIFGARKNNYGSNAFCFFAKCDKDLNKSCYNRSGKETRGGSYPKNVKTTLTCLGKTSTWKSEGGTSGGITTDGTDNDGVNTMFVFNLNTADTGGKTADTSGIGMKLYAFKISEADEVKRDFVPAKRLSDGKIGLLDLANFGPNEFYVNRGTGADFTAGEATGEKYGCGGELHVNVANGETVENTSVTLSGSLKLVKEGEGTLVTTKGQVCIASRG